MEVGHVARGPALSVGLLIIIAALLLVADLLGLIWEKLDKHG